MCFFFVTLLRVTRTLWKYFPMVTLPHHWKIRQIEPPPPPWKIRSLPWGGGVWIFSGTTHLHECSVDLKKDLGVEQLFNKISFDRQILLAIQFIESLNVCLGFPLKELERVMTMVPHRTGVLESMTDGLPREKGLCSELSGANI